MSAPFGRIAELFLLRDAERRAGAVGEESRSAVARVLSRARQKRLAAEALWVSGSPAEALHLLREAVTILRAFDGDDAPVAEVPELDADVRSEHGDLYRALLGELDRRADARLPEEVGPAAIRAMRVQRIALSALVGVGTIVALVLLARAPKKLEASASGRYDGAHEVQKAIDGKDDTEWLLPDRSAGWIEVAVTPARKVNRVKVTNARNLPWHDRGAHEIRVEASYKGSVVKEHDDKLPFTSDLVSRHYDVGAKIDRVKVDVRSYHGTGGGLAEVSVE
ncbi:MAG: discoidin domain-containing protein [Deltaproteobacteria bacterium]|nr:discoidin domain-containing protein [Deltaproteobacteria bacterium]